MSHIINVFNIQDEFTTQWNTTHPHIPECLTRHQRDNEVDTSDEYLICCVNADDLDGEVKSNNICPNYTTCICRDTIRPYKAESEVWSLQKAIYHSFDQALDKSMTLNIWSCGLDLCLNTCYNTQDQVTRTALLSYAINDVLAPTRLFFHLTKSTPSHIGMTQTQTVWVW